MAARALLPDVGGNSLGRKARCAGRTRVGTVRPGFRIARARECVQGLPGVCAGRGYRGAHAEFAGQIRHDLILVSLVARLVLLRPSCIQVLVGQSVRILLPTGRHFALFEGRVLHPPVAWPRHRHKRRGNNLACARDKPWVGQPRVADGEPFAEEFRRRQFLAEFPAGVLLGHPVGYRQAEALVQAAAVQDLALCLRIA